MVKLSPFEGIRYKAADVSRLVCPPYDVVSAARRKDLLEGSKDNFISVELPVPFPKSPAHKIKNMPASSPAPYLAAARRFKSLLSRGIMARDPSSYYIYTQKFTARGRRLERSGLVAVVRLEDPMRGSIYPHENILPKPARDRELLLSAVRASTSPVFFLTDSASFGAFIAGVKKHSLLAATALMDGVSHELRVLPPAAGVENFFQNKRLFIADGHHRYDVAWRHSQSSKPRSSEKYALAFITGAFDDGTIVLPTHRIAPVPRAINSILKSFETISAARFKKLQRMSSSGAIPQPLKIRLDGKTRHLRVKNKKKLTDALPRGAPRALAYIAPSIAAATLLSGVRPDQMRYTSSERDAIFAADKGNKLAVILPPTPIRAIIEISRHRACMPQKSTYFYPKIYAGFVVYAFEKK